MHKSVKVAWSTYPSGHDAKQEYKAGTYLVESQLVQLLINGPKHV